MGWEQVQFRGGASFWLKDEDESGKPKALQFCPGPTYGENRSMRLVEGQTLSAGQIYELQQMIQSLAPQGEFQLSRDHELFPGFVRYMASDEEGMSAKDLAYLVEKPWKWTPEFLKWRDDAAND
jgi:hypothetical protein